MSIGNNGKKNKSINNNLYAINILNTGKLTMADIIIALGIAGYPAAIFIRDNNLKLFVLSIVDFLIFISLKSKIADVRQAFVFLVAALVLNAIIYFIKPGADAETKLKKTNWLQEIFIYILNFAIVVLSVVFIIKTPALPQTGKSASFEEIIIIAFLLLLFSYAGYFFIKNREPDKND